MEKQARHRPHREYPGAKRVVLDPDIENCPICDQTLKARRNWHSRKTIQTLNGPLFVAGKAKSARIASAAIMVNGIMRVKCGCTVFLGVPTDWMC